MAYREASRIPAVTLEELVGSNPTIEMVIREPIGDLAVGTLWDLFALVAIARTIKAQRIFEFGTGYGRSTINIAANTPADASILTLDIPSHPNTGRIFHNQPEEKKIIQLWGDSKEFEFEPYLGTCDLVFVDGAHDYETVAADSRIALRLIKTSGHVLWDDMAYEWKGVRKALRELSQSVSIRHIVGTKLAHHCAEQL
jgi:predicted O-methyltransferase YrrM